MKAPITICLGAALALSTGACHHKSTANADPAASASAAADNTPPADSAAVPAPSDSAAIPTEQDYEEQAVKTVSTSQSLDSQVNAIAKEIGSK